MTQSEAIRVLRECLILVIDTVGCCHDCWTLSASEEDLRKVEQALAATEQIEDQSQPKKE